MQQSANMHMIPADRDIARRLKRVRRGDVVEIEGQLVSVQRANGWRWTSSLTRSDQGDGACELVYVTHLRTD